MPQLKVRRTVEIPADTYAQLEARAERGAVNALLVRYIQEGLERDIEAEKFLAKMPR